MPNEAFSIEIEGEELTDIYADVLSLQVELDEEMMAMARLQLFIVLQDDGSWTHLDDDNFSLWNNLEVNAGFDDEMEPLFSGPITHLKPVFDSDPSQCMLELWAMDKSVLLDREEKLKDWPDKKDSDIAQEIFAEYSLSAEVEDTSIIHDQAVSTIIQRETDMQFLRRLALRNGYECFVEGDTAYFRPPQLDEDPQPVLSAHFGADTTLSEFSAEVDAQIPANVSVHQIDRMNKEVISVDIDSSQQTTFGGSDASALLPTGGSAAKSVLSRTATTGEAEMTSVAQGLFHRSEWFVSSEGMVDANIYRHVLKPRRTVTVRGVGETYSGIYYVTHVAHIFDRDGYRQAFRAKRNAIMPSGTESFDG